MIRKGPFYATVCVLALASTAVVVALMGSLDRTADEVWYINAGRSILRSGWEHPATVAQGPLPVLATQLLLDDLPPGGEQLSTVPRAVLFRARLGMLPFFLVAGAILLVWTRAAFGAPGALLALLAFTSHPLLLSHAGLTAVDMSHTAGTLLVLFCTWIFVERRSGWAAAALGAGLGLGLGTKSLLLLQVPVVAASMLLASHWDPRGWRVGLRNIALTGACALLTLHGCFGFSFEMGYGLAREVQSESLRSVLELPIVGGLAASLPRPFLQGLDFHLSETTQGPTPYWMGRFASVHPAYYVGTFLVRTPEWILLLTLASIPCLWKACCAPDRKQRTATWILLGGILVPLLYLSLLSPVQRGVRYALPQVALGCAALAVLGEWARAPAVLRRTLPLLALLGAWQLVESARQWPDLLSYFNSISGGPSAARRWFCDTNADWQQHDRDGLEKLRARWGEGLVLLPTTGGPRFGVVAASLGCLCARDPLDPQRGWHWLHALEPAGSLAASFWIYRIDARAFERAAASAGQPRVWADLAVAHAGSGELARARELLPLAQGDARCAALTELIALEERGPPAGPEDALLRAGIWLQLEREDLAKRLVTTFLLAGDARFLELLVDVLLHHQDFDGALAARAAWSAPLSTRTQLLLCAAALQASRIEEAIHFLEAAIRELRAAGVDVRAYEQKRAELEATMAQTQAYRRSIR